MSATTIVSGELTGLLGELDALAGEARATFGGLSAQQLNWKPTPEQWSVGQCFDHLVRTNQSSGSTLEDVARGGRRGSAWERLSPLSGFFGRLVLKSLAPDSGRKFKAPRGIRPATSDVDADVVSQFVEYQGELIELMKRAAAAADPKKIVITSPVAKFITYDLDHAFRIVVMHERRHLRQARRVTEAEGFPQ